MHMVQKEISDEILKVELSGSFDIAGAADVDLPFNVIAGTWSKVAVDFSDVDFLASIGVRVLVKSARTMAARGGKMVVINPGEAARKVMTSTGVDQIVPIVNSEPEALAQLA